MTISSRSTSPRPTSSGGRSPLDHTCYPRAKSHSQSQSHSGNKPFEISPHSHSVHPLPKQAVAVVSANSAHSHSFHSSPTHAQSASHRSLQSRHLRQQHQHQHPPQQQPLHQRATASHPTHVQTIAHTHTHRSHPHSPHSTSPLNPSPRALAISTTALPLSFTTDKSPLSPRRPLNYPLPLSSDQHLAAVALMQERQESWTRIAQHAASSSSASTTSSRAGSVSPIQSVRGFGPSSAIGSSELGGPSGTGGAAGGNGNAAKTKGGKSGKPRKKVAKACLACQKSHLTCDERESGSRWLRFGYSLTPERPCTRCVKKGIGEACVEGVRKKAKYLLEGDERGEYWRAPLQELLVQLEGAQRLVTDSRPAGIDRRAIVYLRSIGHIASLPLTHPNACCSFPSAFQLASIAPRPQRKQHAKSRARFDTDIAASPASAKQRHGFGTAGTSGRPGTNGTPRTDAARS